MSSDRPFDPALFPENEAGPSNLNRPSLFELLAQEQLRDLLHPVIRYVLSYFAQRHPRYLLRILNHHEEFFACLLLLIEHHHLKKYDASLSENFYQLHLVPTTRIPTPRSSHLRPKSRLSRSQRWGLLLFLVGLPYVRARAQDYYERLGDRLLDEVDSAEPSLPVSSRVQKSFRLLYPYVNTGLDLWLLSYDLRYLFGKTDSYRPWHKWLGVRVERRDEDGEILNPLDPSWSRHLPPLLPPLLLLLKLSQWWYSPQSPRTIASESSKSAQAEIHAAIPPPKPLPILPSSGILPPTPPASPPPSDKTSADSAEKEASQTLEGDPREYTVGPETYGHCPLCSKKWQNPAVLPSGWVVCWRCGWDAIEGSEEDEEDSAEERESKSIATDDKEIVETERIAQETRQAEAHDPTAETIQPLGEGTKSQIVNRKGRCPITGMEVRAGDLRRVLV